jgi:hypothetical protein
LGIEKIQDKLVLGILKPAWMAWAGHFEQADELAMNWKDQANSLRPD